MKSKVLNPTAKELRSRSVSQITPLQQKQPQKPRQPVMTEKETIRYAEISAVVPGSIADRSGVKKGDKILTVNAKRIRDIIDYLFITSAPKVEIAVLRDMERVEELLSIAIIG
ncbi:MAG: PDZ domain-containing protein, partial [Actinobacteria bacterium]|nr:PDZ domain-containing protein [Actinomycetota bacterium]